MSDELTEATRAVNELKSAVVTLSKRATVNRWIAFLAAAGLLVASTVGVVGYIEDKRDDDRLVCSIEDFGHELTDALARASDATPEQVEAFRADLMSHLPECEN